MTETFTIWVCPVCGTYDADPILRRTEPMYCFRCGQEAVGKIDFNKINTSYHYTRSKQARESAPLMEKTIVQRVP